MNDIKFLECNNSSVVMSEDVFPPQEIHAKVPRNYFGIVHENILSVFAGKITNSFFSP